MKQSASAFTGTKVGSAGGVVRMGSSRGALTVVAKTSLRHGGTGSLNRANLPEGIVIEKMGKVRALRPRAVAETPSPSPLSSR